jgi:hypothetical protein
MTNTQKKQKIKALNAKSNKQWLQYKAARNKASKLYSAYVKTCNARLALACK